MLKISTNSYYTNNRPVMILVGLRVFNAIILYILRHKHSVDIKELSTVHVLIDFALVIWFKYRFKEY